MASDYERITQENIREYGEGTRHLEFLGTLYSDKTHFIYELLQNAEDAGAHRVAFLLRKEKLILRHDGRVFDEEDVRGICGVAAGTKTKDLTQIGKFGIGFKSVYAYTRTPQIQSGDECFRIESFVRPVGQPTEPIDSRWTTQFVFPFDHRDGETSSASFDQIGDRLRNLNVRTMLFLRYIEEIGYEIETTAKRIAGTYLRETTIADGFRRVTVVGENESGSEEERWIVFDRPMPLNDDKYDTRSSLRVELAFLTNLDDREDEETIIGVRPAMLAAFFPTEVETKLGFLIQGPYRTTPARDNVPHDDEWNTQIIQTTADLLKESLVQLRDSGYLGISVLESLPIVPTDFPEENRFRPLFDSVKDAFQTEDLLPDADGDFISAPVARLARGAWLRNLLSGENLSELLDDGRKSYRWITGEITSDRTPELHRYLVATLGIEEIDGEAFARLIDEEFLRKQNDQWFIRLYGSLLDVESIWRRYYNSAKSLRNKPIFLLEDGSVERGYADDGETPQVFLPPDGETGFPTVKRSIAADEKARRFLEQFGLKVPDIAEEVIQIVLPKYAKEPPEPPTAEEYSRDLDKIFQALSVDSSREKTRVEDALRNASCVRCKNTSDEILFRKPTDAYEDSYLLREFFRGNPDAWFVAPDQERDWPKLGVAVLPRFISRDVELPFEKCWELQGRQKATYFISSTDYVMDGLDDLLHRVARDPTDIDGSHALWMVLVEFNRREPRFENTYRGMYRWFYYSEKYARFEPSWLKSLKETAWLPKSGVSECFFKPDEISRKELPDDFEWNEEVARMLGIPSDADVAILRDLGFDLSLVPAIKAHGPEIAEYLRATYMGGQPTILEQSKPAFPERPSMDPERRRERGKDRWDSASPKQYENRQRSVRVSRGHVDPQTSLRHMYTNSEGILVCQICKDAMPFRKRNGDYYFESVEVLPREDLPRENAAQFLALCPVCAAKYREFVLYDQKQSHRVKEAILGADETLELPLDLGVETTTLRFVETHMIDLQEVLRNE